MTLTKLFISAALMAATTFASAADLNNSKVLTLINNNGTYSSHFGNTFTSAHLNKTFLDTYSFNVSLVSDIDALVSSIATISKGKTTLDLNITSFELYAGNLLIGSTNTSDPDYFATGKVDLRIIDGITDAPIGNYSLKIGGTVLGLNGGSYSGNVNVSPIPEPETWGLTIAGLAAVGFVTRRRQVAKSSALPA